MNLASIVPLPAAPAASGKPSSQGGAPSSGGRSSSGAPTGFLDVLAATSATPTCSATKVAASAGAAGEGGAAVAQDLLTLAALASRSAFAALPQVVATVEVDGATDGDLPVASATEDVTTTPATGDSDGAADPAEARDLVDVPAATGDVLPGPSDVPPAIAETVQDEPVARSAPAEAEGPVDAVDAVDAAVGPQAPDTVATGDADQLAPPASTPEVAAEDAAAAPLDEPADDLASQRAVPATPVDRGRGRADRAAARTTTDGVAATRVEGLGAPTPAAPDSAATAVRADTTTPSAAAQRVLDLVTQLEDAPPPRVVVIDTGEVRVRLGLDAGTVRMTVLGPLGETGEELLREAADALEAGGFGTELDRGADGDERGGEPAAHDDRPAPTTAASPRRPPAAASRAGLQL